MSASSELRRHRLQALLVEHAAEPCLVHEGRSFSYGDLDALRREWVDRLDAEGIGEDDVVGIRADFSPSAIALFLALVLRPQVAVLVPPSMRDDDPALDAASVSAVWSFGGTDPDPAALTHRAGSGDRHPLLQGLHEGTGAGFVLYSSGSTGTPKAILHDLERFLSKFDREGKALRTLAFLLFDHIAGLDTMFYTLMNRGVLVLTGSRDPGRVAEVIERDRVEVLPASPTFLRFFALARAQEGRDLSSLRIVTYGSEPMPAATLEMLGDVFPGVDLQQKYGTSEAGSPRSKSRGRDSLWLDMRSAGSEVEVRDGMLWVRSASAMLGYLNAPDPFDVDGWYPTGDRVEVDGHWIRVLGRDSSMINVGGEKVFPEEVEATVAELDDVVEVRVAGEPHPFTGQVVAATVRLRDGADASTITRRVRTHCRSRLAAHKVPVKVRVADGPLHTERHKKVRARDHDA